MLPVYRRHLSYCPDCGADVCPCGTAPPPWASLVGALGRVVEPALIPEAANGPFRMRFARPEAHAHLPGTPVRYQRGSVVVAGVLLAQDSDSVTILTGAPEPCTLPLIGASLESA